MIIAVARIIVFLHCILNEEMIINNEPINTVKAIKPMRRYVKIASPVNAFHRRLESLFILLKK